MKEPFFKIKRQYRSQPEAVDRLIAAAHKHPLGVSFLKQGDLNALAAIFETHIFTVEAARKKLAGQKTEKTNRLRNSGPSAEMSEVIEVSGKPEKQI